MKFKVGDHVQVANTYDRNDRPIFEEKEDWIAKIVRIRDGRHPYGVRFVKSHYYNNFSEEELRKIDD